MSTQHGCFYCARSVVVPKLAGMSERHEIPSLPPTVVVSESDDELRLALPEGPALTFVPVWLASLSSRRAAEIVAYASNELAPRLFVIFRRSSPEARSALQDAEISYAGEDGYVFVRAPGMYVERGDAAPRRRSSIGGVDDERNSAVRNPFANRSSRVARWMLNYPDQAFSPASIAQAVDLNPAAVSRILTALEDAALIGETSSRPGRGRKRTVVLRRPVALLEGWLPIWQRRRIQRWRWDIGAHDVEEALTMLRTVDESHEWAIGGLVGAASLSRAVEPTSVTLWVSAEGVELLAAALEPIDARGGRGTVDLGLAPDPWTLRLSRSVKGLPVADPVQLWLDCASEGERALEAADAVAQIMSWS